VEGLNEILAPTQSYTAQSGLRCMLLAP